MGETMIGSRRAIIFIFLGLLFCTIARNVNGKSLVLDELDNGTHICLNVGDTLSIKLKSNPSTGYSWKIEDLSPVLQQIEAKTTPGKKGSLGEPGSQSFTFKANQPGEAELVLNYLRTFEKKTPPARTFSISIKIEPRAN